MTSVANLALAVQVAELEAAVIAAEAEQGWNVPDARRPLTAGERAAKVKFGDIDARIHALGDHAVTATDPVATAVLRAVETAVTGRSQPAAVQAVTDLASPLTGITDPDVQAADDTAQAAVAALLAGVYTAGATDVRAEAERQGGTPPPDPVPLDAAAAAAITAGALLVVAGRATRTLAAAQKAVTNAVPPAPPGGGITRWDLVGIIRDAVLGASTAGTADDARQAGHTANGAGRLTQATAAGMPPIKYVYASELLDAKTCDPCAAVDGTEWATVDEALAYYRDMGGYRACEGGLRCRGLLVYVFDTETDPTVSGPPPPGGTMPPMPPATTPPTPPPGRGGPTGVPGSQQPRLPDVRQPSIAPVGPREVPSFDDLVNEGLVNTGWHGLDDNEQAIAEWLRRRGVHVQSIRKRDAYFRYVSGLKSPDVVDFQARRTIEFKTVTGIDAVPNQVRQGIRQSRNLIVAINAPRRPTPSEVSALRQRVSRVHGGRIDQFLLLWKAPNGALREIR